MRVLYFILSIFLGVTLNISPSYSQVAITGCSETYNMNFDLANMYDTPCNSLAFTNNSTIPGWYIHSDGSLVSQTWNSGSGCVSGAHYSFGSDLTDRALGTLSNGTTQTQRMGVRFLNQSSSIITKIKVTYTGEQWKQSTKKNKFTFEYSQDATDLITGTYVEVSALTFKPTGVNASPGVLDGNLSMNRKTLTKVITGLNILPGGELWLRWSDIDDTGYDAGMAVDDLSVQFSGTVLVFPGLRETVVCNDNSATNFSVTADQPVTSCTWSLPPRARITGNGTANVSYDWRNVVPGNYTITAKPVVGSCPGLNVTFSVTVVPAANANFTLDENPSCINTPVTISAVDAGQDFYFWQTMGADTQPPGTQGPHVINYSTAGNYSIDLVTTKTSTVAIPSQTFCNFTDFATEDGADCNSGINAFNSTIEVAGINATVPAGISINFTLNHTYDQDVSLLLISPSGQSLVICTGLGGSADDYLNTTISDAAGSSITSASPPFTGSFRPDGRSNAGCTLVGTINTLGGFTGTPALGTWTLRMEDNAGGDFGILRNWSITFPGHDNTVSCSAIKSKNITIDAPSQVATLNNDQTVCEGDNTGLLKLTGSSIPPVIRWEYTEDGINIFPITNTTRNYVFNNLSVNTYFRAILKGTGGCPEDFSNWIMVTVDPPTVGGFVVSDVAYCGPSSGTLYLMGYNGDILQWETSTDNFVTSTVFPNQVDFFDFVNLSQTTQVRAVVKSGVCESAYSDTATITIDYPAEPGTLNRDKTICSNTDAGRLALSGYSGTIVQWEYSTDGIIYFPIINTISTYSSGPLTNTTWFRVLLDGGACGIVYSPVAKVTVIDPGTAGVVYSDYTTCSGSSGSLVLAGNSGTILHWESSVNNFIDVVTIANNTPVLTYSNLTVSTSYRAITTSNEPCDNMVSSAAKITITQNAIPGNLIKNQTPGGNCEVSTGTLTLHGSLGTILRWESSTDNFVTINTIANFTTLYSYSISVPTAFRVVLQNSPCGLVYSNAVNVTQGINLLANAYMECNNKGKIVAVGTGGSNTYTYVIVPNAGIQFPGGVFTGLPPGTYTITVKDEYNCSAVTTVKIPAKLSSPNISATFNITNTSTKVVWDAVNPGNSATYQVRYRLSPNDPWINVNVATNSYVITGLLPDTDYDVSVRVRCIPYPTWSAWSTPTTFRTLLRTEDAPVIGEVTDNLLTLFPNPNRGEFNLMIESSRAENVIVQIIDLTGRIIYTNDFSLSEGNNTLQIQPKNIASGTYILQASIGSERKMIKLVVE